MQTIRGIIYASTLDQLGEGDVEVSVGGVGADEGYDRPGSVLGQVLLTVSRGGRFAEVALTPEDALKVSRWINEAVTALAEANISRD